MSMTPEEAIEALRPWIVKQERPAWIPRTSPHDNDAAASKFCGRPLLLNEEAWPTCKCCNLPLELFLQLDLTTLPDELGGRFGSDILQLFYCASPTNCEPGWEAFSNQCSLCRIISREDSQPAVEYHNRFPPKSIDGWDRIIDYPDPEEHDRLGIIIDYHWHDVPYQPTELKCPELGLHFVGMNYVEMLHETVTSAAGDKLSGWPNWIQSREYPSCPECGSEMVLIMQLDSEDQIPYMFGDAGTGHITQCPQHKQVVAFGWACC